MTAIMIPSTGNALVAEISATTTESVNVNITSAALIPNKDTSNTEITVTAASGAIFAAIVCATATAGDPFAWFIILLFAIAVTDDIIKEPELDTISNPMGILNTIDYDTI